MQIHPYLFFNGTCEAAVEFYKKAIGARVDAVMRYKDSPDPQAKQMCPPGSDDKVMHTSLWVGESMIMASDSCGPSASSMGGFSLSLSASTVPEVTRLFNALADGGKVTMPLTKTFWSESFGMLVDKFGVAWMVMVTPARG